MVSHAELQETDFMKQFLQYLQNLEDKEIISIQFLLNSFPESMMLCYLLVKGYLKQGEFLRAILACRYELLDGYLEETTNDDYRNAYQLWQNDVIVSLTYLDKFGSPDREYLLNLVESEETETKEFKAALRFDMKTGLNPQIKIFTMGLLKLFAVWQIIKKLLGRNTYRLL